MKHLWLLDVSGLYQEFYQPDSRTFTSETDSIVLGVLDAGSLFWAKMLEKEHIIDLVKALDDNFLNPENHIPQFCGIMADKDRFVADVLDVRISVCDQGLRPQSFFRKLETLAIVCELYSRFGTSSFPLTLQSGFEVTEVSAREIIYNSLSNAHNPYLPFINEIIIPLIRDYSPNIIFCSGKVSYFHIAVARSIKKFLPDVHISFTRHSSEYFSLNKIEGYLKNNDLLFTIVDSIILEYFDESESRLLECLQSNGDVSRLANIMTASTEGRVLKRRSPHRHPPLIDRRKKQVAEFKISPEIIYDIHFEPNVKCYWNKCAFCGINKKYSHKDALSDEIAIRNRIEKLCTRLPDDSYLWFIDEAILPSKLDKIAEIFLANNRRFIWQARCRIDSGLLAKGLAEKLAQSGLKELRLGLESGSLSVLKLMNKFEDTFNLELVEKIVSAYSDCGIAVHFPIIIGFPGEVELDRHKTYNFLAEIQDRHPSVSFNVNVFNLDVASPIFKQWDKHAVSQVTLPCQPADFVGNSASWDGPTKVDNGLLDKERNSFMRERLYSWMPSNTLVTPAIFYRLSETIRNTLVWQHEHPPERKEEFNNMIVQLSNGLVRHRKQDGEYLFYNWKTHHYFEGGDSVCRLLDIWKFPQTIKQGVEALETDVILSQYRDDIGIYLKKLLQHGHFVEAPPRPLRA